MSSMHHRPLHRALLTVAAAAVAILATGCAGIPQRAIANGRAMEPQAPLQMRNMRDMAQLRAQYHQIAPLRSLSRTKPYQPFGRWP